MANNKRHPFSCVSGSPRAPDPVSETTPNLYRKPPVTPVDVPGGVILVSVNNTWNLNPETQNSVAIKLW
jgi:hypothetical protein